MKLSDQFQLHTVTQSPFSTLLTGNNEITQALLICQPHRNKKSESEWNKLMNDPTYQVSIDLYDTGLLIQNHKLHPQHFLLK
ncbi:MAG: hypothetical protein KBT04_06070 [Bacteroidales bacterium]|nr:hypothetical protein [Candidatus Colimorpha onthohippi]